MLQKKNTDFSSYIWFMSRSTFKCCLTRGTTKMTLFLADFRLNSDFPGSNKHPRSRQGKTPVTYRSRLRSRKLTRNPNTRYPENL